LIKAEDALDVGSHNFTEGAWGRKSSKSLRISNTELGVVLPVNAQTRVEAEGKLQGLVCWSRPGEECEYAFLVMVTLANDVSRVQMEKGTIPSSFND